MREKKQGKPTIILIGTYRREQMKKWILPKALYNYPVLESDNIPNDCCSGIEQIWLYSGKQLCARFSACFVKVARRKDLKGYPFRGVPHGEKYLLFKVKPLRIEDRSLGHASYIVRLSDFVRSPAIAKRLKKQLSVKGANAALILNGRVPDDLLKLPEQSLKVCEGPFQMVFWDGVLGGGHVSPFRNVWDKDVEVERSAYAWTKDPIFIERLEPLQKGKLNVVELFCGCGGTSCGFEMVGYQTVMGVDILEPAIETFRKNHKTATTYLGDIRKISAADLCRHIPASVDVLVAGIPCQGFSLNNRKRHDLDKRNSLYLELLRILKVIKPKAVVVENVLGIRSSSNGMVVQEIETGIFKACGLTVKHKLLHAADYGVPQKRSRVVFIGVKDPSGFDFNDIAKTHGPETEKPFVTIRNAIGDLPRLQQGESASAYCRDPDCEYQKNMRGQVEVLTNHKAPKHPAETVAKIANTMPGAPMYPKFKQRIRLAWDILSPTQVSGGIRPQFQFGHPDQSRGLTIRERCRIQSFPDSFEVFGGLVQGRVQTGNAVPPLLAKAIAKALKKYLQPGLET